MTRLAIIAPRTVQEDVIEELHNLRLAHLEAFTQSEDETLNIGEPLPAGSRASELLVRLRGVLHSLNLEGEPSRRLEQDGIRSRIEDELQIIESAVKQATDERDTVRKELDQVRDQISRLEPLTQLPLDLHDYHGYDSLRVFIGQPPRDLSDELAPAIARFEYFPSPGAHALFVHEDEAERAQEILTREGFQAMEVPEGEGSLQASLSTLQRRQEALKAELEATQAELDQLAEEHGDLLLAAEEDLSIEVDKAEAPLDFASTERTIIVDAWVPTKDLDTVKTAIDQAARGRVAFEVLDEGDRDDHHRSEAPPTRYDHPPGVRPFSVLLDVFSPPKYGELDPTLILSIVFPFFFGFMIGDLGYGILMVALGLLLYRRIGPKSPEARGLGFALLIAGLWASFFGLFIFHDALGIPFAAHGHEGALNWEGLLGIHLPLGDVVIEKLGNEGVREMLALSILAAFVHLFLGFVFGFINHFNHSKKHAFAQIGWIGVLAGFFVLVVLKGPTNGVSDAILGWMGNPELITSAYLLGPGLLILVATEGAMGVMETFSLLSNMISYTRLAGVAVAKGAMASAFNGIFLADMALGGSGLVLVTGFVLFIIAQLIVLVLGLISSGIQGIRLNYVEFFLKFYEGGGEPFRPFGRLRKFTTPSTERTEV